MLVDFGIDENFNSCDFLLTSRKIRAGHEVPSQRIAELERENGRPVDESRMRAAKRFNLPHLRPHHAAVLVLGQERARFRARLLHPRLRLLRVDQQVQELGTIPVGRRLGRDRLRAAFVVPGRADFQERGLLLEGEDGQRVPTGRREGFDLAHEQLSPTSAIMFINGNTFQG